MNCASFFFIVIIFVCLPSSAPSAQSRTPLETSDWLMHRGLPQGHSNSHGWQSARENIIFLNIDKISPQFLQEFLHFLHAKVRNKWRMCRWFVGGSVKPNKMKSCRFTLRAFCQIGRYYTRSKKKLITK
jgi:hypothetical protein